jgi:hypothetical protein
MGHCSIRLAVMKYVNQTPPYRGGNMDLGDVHAVLIDLGAKGKLGAICNAMAPFFFSMKKAVFHMLLEFHLIVGSI